MLSDSILFSDLLTKSCAIQFHSGSSVTPFPVAILIKAGKFGFIVPGFLYLIIIINIFGIVPLYKVLIINI
jgi:hypothetical protein